MPSIHRHLAALGAATLIPSVVALWHPGSMLSALREMIWPVLRCMVPYPDLPRRRRVRRKARDLIACEPWPGDNATGDDAAQLALYHLLWLQRETHRAVRWHRSETAALLARESVETYIVGTYCLHTDSAVPR